MGQAADVSRVTFITELHNVNNSEDKNIRYEWKALGVNNASNPLSQITLPVVVNGLHWASITFEEYRRERQWTNMELEAFQTAASILGAAESRAQTIQQSNQRQLALGLLQDIATVSLQAENLVAMAKVSTERLAKLIKADGCYLTLWDDTHKQVVPVVAYGALQQTYSNMYAKTDEKTFTQSSLELEKTLIVEDVFNTPYASESVVERFLPDPSSPSH